MLARHHLRPAAILAVLTTIVVAACSGGGNEPQAVTVLEWAGYEAPDFWTDFQTANPDVAVDFQFGTTDADILSKMENGSTADVFHAQVWTQQLGRQLEQNPQAAEPALNAAGNAAKALWKALDGIEARRMAQAAA